MGLSKNIRALREKHGLTQQDLAEIAGVSNKAVSAWETGQKEPRMGAIEKMAVHFNIRKSSLIEDDEDLRDITTLAAHHDGGEWTEEELTDIEKFKEFVRSKRNAKS